MHENHPLVFRVRCVEARSKHFVKRPPRKYSGGPQALLAHEFFRVRQRGACQHAVIHMHCQSHFPRFVDKQAWVGLARMKTKLRQVLNQLLVMHQRSLWYSGNALGQLGVQGRVIQWPKLIFGGVESYRRLDP